jgi:uroporphyrinogen-III synthase
MPTAVVVTASAGTFPGLADALRQAGVPVEDYPLMSFAPPLDWGPLDRALNAPGRFDAIALTSPRAARAFGERWRARGEPTLL